LSRSADGSRDASSAAGPGLAGCMSFHLSHAPTIAQMIQRALCYHLTIAPQSVSPSPPFSPGAALPRTSSPGRLALVRPIPNPPAAVAAHLPGTVRHASPRLLRAMNGINYSSGPRDPSRVKTQNSARKSGSTSDAFGPWRRRSLWRSTLRQPYRIWIKTASSPGRVSLRPSPSNWRTSNAVAVGWPGWPG